jgi:twitching motility protein PilT
MEMKELLRMVIARKASDLHIIEGTPPLLRINGELVPVHDKTLASQDAKDLIYSILTPEQQKRFEKENELDFSYALEGLSRFRVNVHFQKGSVAAALRAIPFEIFSLEKLGLPPILADLTRKPRGLVLVTGVTGSGKSTTLASMINLINQERSCHIITIEDPVEYLHKHGKSYIEQREVYSDTHSFTEALRHVLRQDPDVILIGEMRDLETISIALTAAETGHLVFATLHTVDAAQTVDRVVDVFPPYQQQQVRLQLSATLRAIISQQLLPRMDGKGRVVVVEVLIATPAIRNLIREGKTPQIYSAIETGSRFGMQSMDQDLSGLYRKRVISYEEAMAKAVNPQDLERLIKTR